MTEVKFRGKLTPRNIIDAYNFHMKPFKYWHLSLTLFIVGLLWIIRKFFIDGLFVLSQQLPGLFVLVLSVIIFLETKKKISQSWKGNKLIDDEINGLVSDDKVAFQTEHSSSEIPWEKLIKYKSSSDLMMIYFSSRSYFLIPRAFVDSELEWDTLYKIVKGNVKYEDNKKRLLINLLVWVLAFIVVLIILNRA